MKGRKWDAKITLEDKLLFVENRKGLLVSLRKQKMLQVSKFTWMMNLLNSIEEDIIKQSKRNNNASR